MGKRYGSIFAFLIYFLVSCTTVTGQDKRRARDLQIPFEGKPGTLNAITDVKGVTVGHTTVISGESVRTGVTAILPRGEQSINQSVFAAWFTLNGNGEMTGTTWIEESGFLEGPVMITNTHSVGVVRDAVIKWRVEKGKEDATGFWWSLPVVAETWDGYLNDINGFHVTEKHAFQALDHAKSGPVAEGNVGGGTGMICYGFKGGIGTSSREVETKSGNHILGVLVQANFGRRNQLHIAGVPVGKEIPQHRSRSNGGHSIIAVIATDAPLLPHQLKRVARRASLGIARTGAVSTNSSGDIFIAFSTANADAREQDDVADVKMLPNSQIDAIFTATVQATEEAIVNALVAAETMTGRDNHTVQALPHERLRELLKKYNRLAE